MLNIILDGQKIKEPDKASGTKTRPNKILLIIQQGEQKISSNNHTNIQAKSEFHVPSNSHISNKARVDCMKMILADQLILPP